MSRVRTARYFTFLKLILMAMVIAGFYGAVHDQISFTVSSEYFTAFKYIQFELVESALPDRVKAAVIGFLASWWMGIPIGLVVGGFGFLHQPADRMWNCSLRAFLVVAVVALLTGCVGLMIGWSQASRGLSEQDLWHLPEGLEAPGRFLAVGWMHNFSYLGGMIGLLGGVLAQFVQRRRVKTPEMT